MPRDAVGPILRYPFALVACVLVVGMSAVALLPHPQEPAPTGSEFVDALWVATDHGLLKVDSSNVSTLSEIPKIGDIKALDIDDRRGLVWFFTKNRLRGISFGGEVRFTAPKDDDDDDDRGRSRLTQTPKTVPSAC